MRKARLVVVWRGAAVSAGACGERRDTANEREAIEQAGVRGRLSRYRRHDDEDFRARGAKRRRVDVSWDERNGESRRVPSGSDGRPHDVWVHQWRRRHATGRVTIVRYADDFVMGFEKAADAQRMMPDLKERLAKFGLRLHEEKTRLIEFGRFAASARKARGEQRPETSAFLGFTHYCGWTRDGRFIVKHKTQSSRLTRKLTAIRQEARQRMRQPLTLQHRWLASVLRGHYGYFGMPHNWRALNAFRQDIRRICFKCLRRRSQKNRRIGWDWFEDVTARLPLPLPRITHPWSPTRASCG